MLTDTELRVLGCLIEKQMTTPDYYPLTLNALVAACNQKNNRDPVVSYDEATVVAALDGLRDRGLGRAVHRPGQRTVKYRHAADEQLRIDPEQAALLSVLMLRGAQTLGELRTRTERYHDFGSLGEVADVLGGLASRDESLVEQLERRPGEKEPRWRHLLGAAAAEEPAGAAATGAAPPTGQPPAADAVDRVGALEAAVSELRGDLDALAARLEALIAGLGGTESRPERSAGSQVDA